MNFGAGQIIIKEALNLPALSTDTDMLGTTLLASTDVHFKTNRSRLELCLGVTTALVC